MRQDSNTIMLLPVPRNATFTGGVLVLPEIPNISFTGLRENAVHQAIAVELGPVRRGAAARGCDRGTIPEGAGTICATDD